VVSRLLNSKHFLLKFSTLVDNPTSVNGNFEYTRNVNVQMNKLLLLVVILQKISLASVCSQKNFGMGEMGETFLLLMVVATQKRFSINLGPAVNILEIVRDKIEFKYHFKILYFK